MVSQPIALPHERIKCSMGDRTVRVCEVARIGDNRNMAKGTKTLSSGDLRGLTLGWMDQPLRRRMRLIRDQHNRAHWRSSCVNSGRFGYAGARNHGPFLCVLWVPANEAGGNPDNIHCGVFLSLIPPWQECACPTRYAERISVQNQELAPARSTWGSPSVRAHEIGTGTTITFYLSQRFPRRLEKGATQCNVRAPISASFKGGGATCFSNQRVQFQIGKTILRPSSSAGHVMR